LMRAGYSGSQRYGMIPWSGDVNRTWGGLKPQMEITMQMGLQGMAYMHSDLGGFAGANNDPELYVRWLQYGVFQPIFRPHAQEDVASEAIFKDPKTKALAKAAIELRYQLLPYNYSLAFVNSTSGHPLMRPIFMEFLEETWSFTEANSYMWGPSLLVHAITDSMKSSTDNVYNTKLPTKVNWFDFHTGKLVHPDANQLVTTPKTLESIPVFAKSGAFIPRVKTIQSTNLYTDTLVTMHCYLAKPSATDTSIFVWYEDDGSTKNAILKGAAKMLRCEAISEPNRYTVTLSPTIQDYAVLPFFQFEWAFHMDQAPKTVKVNGKKEKFTFDAANQVLYLNGQQKMHIAKNEQVLQFKW